MTRRCILLWKYVGDEEQMSRTGVEAKPPWKRVPKAVRQQVEAALGASVVRAARIWGGYSIGRRQSRNPWSSKTLRHLQVEKPRGHWSGFRRSLQPSTI